MKSIDSIFAIVPDCHAKTGRYGRLWRRHFYEGLQRTVPRLVIPERIDFSWARPKPGQPGTNVESDRKATAVMLLDQILAAHSRRPISCVISCCFSGDIDLHVVKAARDSGIPWVNFYCDSTHRFDEVEMLAKETSLNWFPEHDAEERYEALGVPTLCKPYAVNIEHLPDLSCVTPRRDIVFIGYPSSERIYQLAKLRLLGSRVDIYGPGWVDPESMHTESDIPLASRILRALKYGGVQSKLVKRIFSPILKRTASGELDDQAFCDVVSTSRLVLGLNEARDRDGLISGYLKFRDIEFPGYGCCYITQRNSDVISAFNDGKEVLTYNSAREAAKLIKHYSSSEEIREIGMMGRERVKNEHTWPIRLKQIGESLADHRN